MTVKKGLAVCEMIPTIQGSLQPRRQYRKLCAFKAAKLRPSPIPPLNPSSSPPLPLSPAALLSYLSLVQQAEADGILAQPHKAPGAVDGVQHPVPTLHWSHTHISHVYVHQISIMVQLRTTDGTIAMTCSAAVCGNHLLTACTAKLWQRLHNEADCAGAKMDGTGSSTHKLGWQLKT